MADQELSRRVKELRSSGKTDEQIIEALTGSNWTVNTVRDVVFEREPAANGETVITVNNVSKHYKKLKALDGVSLEVKRGSVTALLGPNGAGKTTLVRTMTTLLDPTSGTVTVDGIDVVKEPQKLRSIIGLAGQNASVDEILTGRENLIMFARLYHVKPAEAKARASELLKQFNLEEAADRPIKTYSGGMRRRLDLAASLVIHPKVLFLDEPTTGLDPRGRFGLWNVIRDLVEDGTTVLLTTQYLEEADQLADKIFVIDHGKIIAQGTPDELKRQTGGDILELHLTNHADATKAAEIVKKFGDKQPNADAETGIVTMPVAGGASILIEVVREIDQAKLTLSDVMLRRPSLDDVFMKLTGHGAE